MNIMLPSKRKSHYKIIDHETANKQSDKQTTKQGNRTEISINILHIITTITMKCYSTYGLYPLGIT